MARLMAEREELCFHCEFGLEFLIRERDYRSEMKMDMCVGFGSVRLYAEHICSDS